MPETVLISGATGFIAAHIVQQLLEKGYNVVGSVRSVEKGEHLKLLLNNPNFSYEVVESIETENAFDNFVKNHSEATVFLHTASPFRFDIKDITKDFLEPAVNGTKNALNAIWKFGPQIKRVVVTSSYAAIANFKSPQDPNRTENEDSWCELDWETSQANLVAGYCGSKTLAEKAAWEFVEEHKPNFALATVNPVYVFGPQPFDEQAKNAQLNTSAEVINSFLSLKPGSTEWKKQAADAVDVRDVAAAHIVGFEKDEAKGQRLFLISGFFTDQTILDILHEDFPQQTKDLPVGTPGTDSEALKKRTKLDNSRTRSILGFELRPVRESVHDTAAQILKYKQ